MTPRCRAGIAEIRRSWAAGMFRLSDLSSTNGTFLNDRRIKRPAKLTTGDELRFGSDSARFIFICPPKRRWIAILQRCLVAFGVLLLAGFGATLFVTNGSLRNLLNSAQQRDLVKITDLSKQLDSTRASLAREKELAALPEWLKRVNTYRALAKLPPVKEDPQLSDGDFKHARYLEKFWLRKQYTPPGSGAHSEVTGDPWYTPEGFAAATASWHTPEALRVTKAGDVIPLFYGNLSGEDAIDEWVAGPFHRLAILDPDQRSLGYGQYCESATCAAALSAEGLPLSNKDPTPLMFPPDGSSIRLAAFQGEWPDPLASCPGYKGPTGLPITLQFEGGIVPKLSAYSITRSGMPIEACGFDAFSYVAPDTAIQNYARYILKGDDVIVLVPRKPFVSGEEYKVSVTANEHVYDWHFFVK